MELQYTQMNYNWKTVDDVPSYCEPSSDLDMLMYSSDVTGDVMKVGAMLSAWRRTSTVVFHIRDEAQSLAKAEMNEYVPCHAEYVPPPPTLQYLRHYFGNLFGLNCLVTATMFPTLLEERLWGFFGSTGQNVRAGLPIAASAITTSARLGANYLPRVVPALCPHTPDGYIGVEHVDEWKYESDIAQETSGGVIRAGSKKKGDVATLQFGANHSGVRYKHTDSRVQAAPQLVEAKARATRRSQRNVKDAKAEAEYEELNQRVTRHARNDMKDTLMGRVTADRDDVNAADEYNKEDPDYEVVANTKKLTPTQLKQEKERYVREDQRAIDAHFQDWLQQKEVYLNTLRGDSREIEGDDRTKLVPTYIGALNSKVADEAMVSFVRHFANLAHERASAHRKEKRTSPPKREFGVAFCLFTSVFKNRADVETKGGQPPIRFSNIKELEKVDGASTDASFVPCEGSSERSDMAMVCFVYDPEESENLPPHKKDFVPAFYVFMAPSAEVAIQTVWDRKGISKVAILGYGMLEAGLTVQSVVTVPSQKDEAGHKRIYAPKYVALATAENASLDGQLQIAGRSFVELKDTVAPPNWKIQLLGVKGMQDRLVRYSDMEKILADINSNGKSHALYEALKQAFSASLMQENSYGTLGVVGTRRGDFGSILGLTAVVAQKRAAAASRARDWAAKRKAEREAAIDPEPVEDMTELEKMNTRAEEEFQQMQKDAEEATEGEDEQMQEVAVSEVDEVLDRGGSPLAGKKRALPSEVGAALRRAPFLMELLQTATGREQAVLHHIIQNW